MIISTLFPHSVRQVTPAAEAALRTAGCSSDAYFRMHESGDWGEAPDWLQNDNRRAIANERSSHAIRSMYRLDGDIGLLLVTSPDRSVTRLMLASEFVTREVSSREGYAQWAGVYDGDNPLIMVEEPVFDSILAASPAYRSAVDVCTGTGRIACKLGATVRTAEVVGYDLTPEMLVLAKDRAEREALTNVRFEPIEIGREPLPLADGSIDLLTCALALCHLPDYRVALAEFVRVLLPGGRIILSDFHPAVSYFGWRPDFTSTGGRLLLPYTPSSREGYLSALSCAGCDILEVHDIGLDGKPYGEVTEDTMKAKGAPPLCIVISAVKRH